MSTLKRRSTPQKLSPAHQAMAAKVEQVVHEWRGPGPRPPHAVAHEDPDTKLVTWHLRGMPDQLAYIRDALAAYSGQRTR